MILRPEVEHFLDRLFLGDHRGVPEHHPLRVAGGTGGVDDRRQIIGACLRETGLQGPGFGFGPEVVVGDDPFRHALPGFENHQVLQFGQVIGDLQDAFALAAPACEQDPQPGIGSDVPDLFRGGGGVDGHRDGPHGGGAEVYLRPLGTVVREQTDAVARPDSPVQQPLRRLVDALTELAEGVGAPVVADPDPGGWTVGMLGDGRAHLYGEVLDHWSSWSETKDRGSWRRQVP